MRRPVVLALLVAVLAVVLAGCGGDDEGTGAEETTPTTTQMTGGEESGDATAGKEVFATAGCGGCHTFAPAGSSGTTGPSLDDADVTFDEVVEQVTNGGGAMPAFRDQLSDQQIRDVAAFVTSS